MDLGTIYLPSNCTPNSCDFIPGHMCAIKYICKKRLKLKNQEKSAFEEREMLLKFDSPFIVGLNYAFQTENKLCFVLDLMKGE